MLGMSARAVETDKGTDGGLGIHDWMQHVKRCNPRNSGLSMKVPFPPRASPITRHTRPAPLPSPRNCSQQRPRLVHGRSSRRQRDREKPVPGWLELCTSTLETRWKETVEAEGEEGGRWKRGQELFEYNRDSCRFVGRPRVARGAEEARSLAPTQGEGELVRIFKCRGIWKDSSWTLRPRRPRPPIARKREPWTQNGCNSDLWKNRPKEGGRESGRNVEGVGPRGGRKTAGVSWDSECAAGSV